MKGKLIVIEGTDCSGKETQTKMLIEKLNSKNIKCVRFSFPMYDTPTGKIIGGPYLGKEYICDCWFDEGAINVDPKVSALYYTADRLYNIDKINNELNKGVNVILDRYVYSNLAHQGGKIKNKKDRFDIYNFLHKLEFEFLSLPQADIKVFLHMPYQAAHVLRQNRLEKLDQLEKSKEYLISSEKAYKEISKIYNFKTIECSANNTPKKIEEINTELYNYVISNL